MADCFLRSLALLSFLCFSLSFMVLLNFESVGSQMGALPWKRALAVWFQKFMWPRQPQLLSEPTQNPLHLASTEPGKTSPFQGLCSNWPAVISRTFLSAIQVCRIPCCSLSASFSRTNTRGLVAVGRSPPPPSFT